MKNFPLILLLFLSVVLFNSCKKEINEPKHKANGADVMYLKVDDQEQFLLDGKNRRLHKKTAAKFNDFNDDVIRFSELTVNNKLVVDFSIYIIPYNTKANFKIASLKLRFDKQTQELDTAFLRQNLNKNSSSVIYFSTESNEYKSYYIDSIIDYKLLKWDTEKKTISFWANCTYSRDVKPTPLNPKIYFYFDLNY
jgi:hypothetical protein